MILYPSSYRVTIGITDVWPNLACGEDGDFGPVSGGVEFSLPEDWPDVTLASAALHFTSRQGTWSTNAIYRSRLGVTDGSIAFDAHTSFAGLTLGTKRRYIASNTYELYASGHVDASVPLGTLAAGELDVTELLADALADGWLDSRSLQLILQVEDFAPGFGPDDDAYGVQSLYDLALELEYTPPPLRISMPASVFIGRTRQASVQRGEVTASPLVVDLTQSPAGRLILPASVTIPAFEQHAPFGVQGATEGLVTVTATAGADEDAADTEVLAAPSEGLGDELGWWCPSRDTAGDGTTTLTDLSGNGNHGTITGSAAWETNAGARCLSLTSGGHVTMGDLALFDFERTAPFSTSAWILVPSGSSTGIDIISKMQDASPNRGWAMRINSPSATVMHLLNSYSSNDLTRQVSYATFDPRGATWRHLAVTYDGSVTGGGISIYWDGVLRAATTATSNLSQTIRSSAPLRIGARPGASASLRFDDARIYGRALAAGEVAILAKSRGVLGDGTLARLAGPLRSRLTNHRINAGRISR